MHPLQHLFDQNRAWADGIRARTPDFFDKLSQQQSPEYLWIGCADSRVPANEIVGLLPGEIFVHRNVANIVVHTDLNCLSCIQYAVEVLGVKHIIVCGHHGCGGVQAAMENRPLGLTDNWLRHVQDVQQKHAAELDALEPANRLTRLCELNVIEQVLNVTQTTVVRTAWEHGRQLTVHGWVYGLVNGRLRDLNVSAASVAESQVAHKRAIRSAGRP